MITTQSKLMASEAAVEELTKQVKDLQAKYAGLMADHMKLNETYAKMVQEHVGIQTELSDTYTKLAEASKSWWSKIFG
jgi:chromosome segregation ATPase